MPFNPRLIQPDEPPLTPQGGLHLPCELAALAEQLGDDARHLATCYPAVRETAAASVAGRESGLRRRRLAKAAILVGSTLAMLLVALFVLQGLESKRSGRPMPIRAESVNSVVRLPAQAASPAAGLAIPSGGATISLTDLSGPELEAVFDLWQRGEEDAPASIAF